MGSPNLDSYRLDCDTHSFIKQLKLTVVGFVKCGWVFLIGTQTFLCHNKKEKRQSIDPFSSMHNDIISFRSHYIV